MYKYLGIAVLVLCSMVFVGSVLADEVQPIIVSSPTVPAKPYPGIKMPDRIGIVAACYSGLPDQLVVKSSTETITFVINDETKIRKVGKVVRFSDIEVGDNVIVLNNKKDNNLVADVVLINVPKSSTLKSNNTPVKAPSKK